MVLITRADRPGPAAGRGHPADWPAWTWASLAAAPVLLAAFAAHELRQARQGRAPLLDLALLRQRALAAGLATQLVFWCGQASLFLVLALYLQPGRGLDALQAGLVVLHHGRGLPGRLAAGARADRPVRPVADRRGAR